MVAMVMLSITPMKSSLGKGADWIITREQNINHRTRTITDKDWLKDGFLRRFIVSFPVSRL